MMDGSQQQVKVIAVGGSGVGKSCLLLRFVNNEFNEFSEPTLGASFISKALQYKQGKFVRFQIWDTAGQQKYKSIAPIYYRDSKVAICVYDITNRQSFKTMKTWVQELMANGPQNVGKYQASIVLAVVGNKIDKSDEEDIPYVQAKQYSQSIGAIFKLTSAKEGKGINQLFISIAQRLNQLEKNQVKTTNNQVTAKDLSRKKKRKCCA